jgi:hypothetical protein
LRPALIPLFYNLWILFLLGRATTPTHMGAHEHIGGYVKGDTNGGMPLAQTAPLRPALVSIKGACEYLGGIGKSAFYERYLPRLDTVRLGTRNLVTVASLDRLIEAIRAEQQR